MKKYIIICKGTYEKYKINEITRIIQGSMSNYGQCMNVLVSKRPGDNVENARRESQNVDMIISVGGDGTFNEVVNGILSGGNQDVSLMHIPMGTANDIGINLNYNNRPREYINQAINNQIDYDIFRLNDNIFTFAAAGGYLTNVAYAPTSKAKKLFGKSAYIYSILTEAMKKRDARNITFSVDGKEYEGTYLAMVLTNSHTIGSFHIYDDISLNDGVCELMMIKDYKNSNIINEGGKVLARKMDLTNMSCIEIYKGSEFTFKLDKPFDKCFDIDGDRREIYGENELKVDLQGRVKVLVPKNSNI
jgi:diacylglycerol kinase family enzyme